MKYELKVKGNSINMIGEMVNHDNILVLIADLKIKRPEVYEISSSDGWKTFLIQGAGEISVKSDASVSICETGRYSVTIVLTNYDAWDKNQKVVWSAE